MNGCCSETLAVLFVHWDNEFVDYFEKMATSTRGDHFEVSNSDSKEDSPISAWGEDQQANNTDNIKDSPTPARGGSQQKMDDELALVENAFE